METERNNEFMLGVASGIASLGDEDIRLMREAGISWLRCGALHFDQKAFIKGENQPHKFEELKTRLSWLRTQGFQFMGITPGPREIVDEAGEPGSEGYFRAVRRIHRRIAAEFVGLIDWWQIANELDIWIFRNGLDMDQSVEFLKAGIEGLKEGGPGLKAGINITLYPSLPGEVDGNTDKHEGLYLAEKIYGDPTLQLDYAGFDSYPGTWRKGGPESWVEYLEGFHRLTGKPVIIQEFGYSSAGEMMSEEEAKNGAYPCQVKKWKFSWKGAHTRELQADFAGESLRIFASLPYVLGATYYSWKDASKCWQCGEPDCPAETAWGLLDREGVPKPSYHRFKAEARKLFATPTPAAA